MCCYDFWAAIMLALIKKPEKSIGIITSVFFDRSTPIKTIKNQKILIDSNEFIFMLLSGEVIITIYGLCTVIKAPFLCGLSGFFGQKESLQFRATDNTVARIIKTDLAVSLCKENGLWKDVAEIMSYNNNLLRILNNELRNPNKSSKYRIFRAVENIYHLQINQKKKLFLAKEVMSLTLLSRSVVMNNISYLKEHDIIRTEKGFLTFLDSEKLKKTLLEYLN